MGIQQREKELQLKNRIQIIHQIKQIHQRKIVQLRKIIPKIKIRVQQEKQLYQLPSQAIALMHQKVILRKYIIL